MKRIHVLVLLVLLPAAPPAPLVRLTAPSAYQVFQRNSAGYATLQITGEVFNSAAPVTVVLNWQGCGVILPRVQNTFTASITCQQGQAALTAQVTGTNVTARVPYVGIGDVYVIAGQSNASGRGDRYQQYDHPTLKAGMFGNDYRWHELADPLDTGAGAVDAVSDDGLGVGGSYWLPLASLLMADSGVPVAFVPTALGGSSIEQWQPRGGLYGALVHRARRVGAIKAILWHQGENDARARTPTALYRERLNELAAAVRADFGVPLIAAQIQTVATAAPEAAAAINHALLTSLAGRGADLRQVLPDDGLHLRSDAALATAARQWFEVLHR